MIYHLSGRMPKAEIFRTTSSVNELKSLEYRDRDIHSFFPIRAIRILLANQWEGMDYDFMVYPCPE